MLRALLIGAVALAGVATGVVAVTGGFAADEDDLAHQIDDNTAHLRAVLPALLPGAKDIKVTGEQADGRAFTAAVTFTDADGPAAFNVSVGVGPDVVTPLAEVCGTAAAPRPTRPDGKPLRCTVTKQPAGDTLVVKEGGVTGMSTVVRDVTKLDAIDYRAGGHAVSIWNDRRIPRARGALRPTYPLAEAHLITLVTDQELGLR